MAQEFADERVPAFGGEAIVFSVALRRFDKILLESNEIGEGAAGRLGMEAAPASGQTK